MNVVRLQALHRAPPPPAADSVGCEVGRRTCSERETGSEELCEIKSAFHIVSVRHGVNVVRLQALHKSKYRKMLF